MQNKERRIEKKRERKKLGLPKGSSIPTCRASWNAWLGFL